MIALTTLGLASHESIGMSLPIQVDGRFEDWPAAAAVARDPIGDGGPSGIDFTALWIANDERRLFLRLDLTGEVQADEGHDITFALDTDRDPNTGRVMNGIGAELVWNLGARSGHFYGPSGTRALDTSALEVLVAPTVSDSRFEIALLRTAVVGEDPVFSGPGFDLVLREGENGDILWLATPDYRFEPGSQAVTPIPLERARPDDVRLASYNVADDGLFLDSRRESIARLFRAIDPDVWVICEVWNHGAADLAAVVEQFLPSGPGKRWFALKLDSGNGVVSRLPILASWLVLPESRLTAVLLDLRPIHDCDLLVVANHWSCCTADESRQQQADALIAFLRDARTSGGVIDLAAGTPIVAAGDFNLVGSRRPLTTLETGDIVEEATFGSDSPPDWDGSAFDHVETRHPEARLDYTWRDEESGFYPGKLDYLFISGSVAIVDRSFVLETAELTEPTRELHGLRRDDTRGASDHAPIVLDFRPLVRPEEPGPSFRSPDAPMVRIVSRQPDPFSSWTELTYSLREAAWVDIDVFDLRGRHVGRLASLWKPAGEHRTRWEAGSDFKVVAGRYLLRIHTDRGNDASWVTILR